MLCISPKVPRTQRRRIEALVIEEFGVIDELAGDAVQRSTVASISNALRGAEIFCAEADVTMNVTAVRLNCGQRSNHVAVSFQGTYNIAALPLNISFMSVTISTGNREIRLLRSGA